MMMLLILRINFFQYIYLDELKTVANMMAIGIYPVFGALIATKQAKSKWEQQMKEMRIPKFVTGYSNTDQSTYLRWPAWSPQTWNSVCITTRNNITRIYSNGQLVATENKDLSGYDATKNILLLGRSDMADESQLIDSAFGSITDVNIWNTSLSREEVNGWSTFQLDLPKYKVFNWLKAELLLKGTQVTVEDLDLETINKETMDLSSSFSIFMLKSKTSFGKGKYNCEGIGGYVSIPGDNIPFTIWNQSTFDISNDHCNGRFFTGYSELYKEDDYVSLYSNSSRSEIKWQKGMLSVDRNKRNKYTLGEPNNWNGHEDCQEFLSRENIANDVTCNKHVCMICQIPTNTVFHLQGGTK